MGYFRNTALTCIHHDQEWQQAVSTIQQWKIDSSIPKTISLPLEAKALYVFTMARRLSRTAYGLRRPRGWKTVFLEATLILFPMIELIGYCRVDATEAKHVYDKSDVSAVNLWAGLHWLRDPTFIPSVTNKHQRKDVTLLDKWQIGHLVSLRHYLLHGSKNAKFEGKTVPVEDILSHEFPGFALHRAVNALPKYWLQLCYDDGTQKWLDRLSNADVRPLKIQGSKLFQDGLIDPDIVECLNGT